MIPLSFIFLSCCQKAHDNNKFHREISKPRCESQIVVKSNPEKLMMMATKWINFLIEDEELLKNIMTVGIKSASTKNKFDSKPKTKIKYHDDKAIDFHKETPEVGSKYSCLAVILNNFLLKKRRERLLASVSKGI